VPASIREEEWFRQRDVLARFGELALKSDDLDEILHEACHLVGQALGTDIAKVMELQPDGTTLLIKAGVGWPSGIVGNVTVQANQTSSEGHALRTGTAVISEDIETEDRFEYAAFIRDAGIRALVNVIIIGAKDQPSYGILQVDSCKPRRFTEDDTKFLRSYANLIAAAVSRLRKIAEMREGEARLRVSEERYRALVTATSNVVYRMNPDWTEMQQLDGRGFLSDTAKPSKAWMLGYIHPDDQAQVMTSIQEAVWAKGIFALEHRVCRADGTVGWTHSRAVPLFDQQGEITEWFGAASDITELKRVEGALIEGEGRLRTLMEGIPLLVWRSGNEGKWTWASPQWLDYTGQRQEESRDWGWLQAVHPDDHEMARQAWHEAGKDGLLDVEFRVRRAADGTWRWHQTRSVPVRAVPGPGHPKGRILEWLGTTTDIEDLKHLQGQQGVLLAELQHRTRNLLAVVRNVARRSIDPSPGRNQYDARLAAMGRVQGFLARSSAWSVPLQELVNAELLAAGDGTSDRVIIDGPSVNLPGDGVQPMALALHELATNAVKYGAIAQPSGHLSVTWRLEGLGSTAQLVLEWRESGVAIPNGLPARQGYGTELITRALPYQLKAKTHLEFTLDGVRCTIALPAGTFRNEDGRT